MRQPYKCSVPVGEANRAALCPVVTFDEIQSPATENRAVVATDRIQQVSIEREIGNLVGAGTYTHLQGNTKPENNSSAAPVHGLTFPDPITKAPSGRGNSFSI